MLRKVGGMLKGKKVCPGLKALFFWKVRYKGCSRVKVRKSKSDLASTLRNQNNSIGELVNELNEIDNGTKKDHKISN